MTNLVITVPSEYISLGLVMQSALEQASKGKGRERHASEGEAYEDQIICEVARRVGLGYPLGQAVKKIYESQRLGGEKGIAELLGAINYIAASVIVEKEEMEAEREEDKRDHEFLNSVFAPYAEKPKAEGVEEPKFKAGDKVQVRVTLPSVSDRIWVDGTYARYDRGSAFPHAVYNNAGLEENVKDEDIRPAPKAEGCEELVQDKEESDVERVFGTLKKRPAPEFDAPQTPQELYKRIIDANPATFEGHTPTGEELAEMAEEEKRG